MMEIANQGANQGSWYVNPNNRTMTSNRKNTGIADRESFGYMRRLLNPAENMIKAPTTPIKQSDQISINREANTVTIAAGSAKAAYEKEQANNRTCTSADEKNFYIAYKSANYSIEPDNESRCLRIYNRDGESLGTYFYSDIKCRQDSTSGKQLLISEGGTMWYDVLVLDQELKEDLKHVMGVDSLETEPLRGYTLKTHAGTGIQYLLKDGDEGRGGRVLLQSEADRQKYEALAETYFNKYPNLIESREEAYIWASFEIRGMAMRTEQGIISIHDDSISYNDNSNVENSWNIRLLDDAYQKIFEWLQHRREYHEDMQKCSVWQSIFDEIGVRYGQI